MRILAFTLAFAAFVPALRGAVVVTLPTETESGTLVFTQPISFKATQDGVILAVIFDEWVTNDGSRNDLRFAFSPGFLIYGIDGKESSVGIYQLTDNVGQNAGEVTPGDGHVYFSSFPEVKAGETFTIAPAAISLLPGSLPAGFNPQAEQEFTGGVFLVGLGGVRMSETTSAGPVPEPTTAAALTLALAVGLTASRRRDLTAR